MGKRKMRSENPQTLDSDRTEDVGGFFACYLLTSLSPRFKGHTYIGFTVNPRRRIRQHNGEIRCGALRTKRKRPWEMVLCIYGFPTNVSALQFEWAWQHPAESLTVRQAAAAFKSFSGVANKIKLAYTMLNLPAWKNLNITVNYFSTKHAHHGAVCPSLPDHMKIRVHSMDELPCYAKNDGSMSDNDHGLVVPDEENDGDICVGKARLHCYVDATSHVDFTDICESSGGLSGPFEECHPRQQCVLSPALGLGLFTSISGSGPAQTTEGDSVILVDKCNTESEFSSPSTDEDGHPGSMGKQSTIVEPLGKSQSVYCFATFNEVEVVDLLTPSPRCRQGSFGEKAIFSPQCPEVIDLTRSPSFVHM